MASWKKREMDASATELEQLPEPLKYTSTHHQKDLRETDTNVAKHYIDQVFILKLLNLFDSEDPRERAYLKTILHRIYTRFMVRRLFIREAIYDIFHQFIKSERHNGIAELLDTLGGIIRGFVLPLKEERIQILDRALVPLHKLECVWMYHQQLSYCITQFVEKDPKLADLVLRGLLKFWPLTNCQNELLFLEELEKILKLTQGPEFQMVATPLFQQIARCLSSPHFQNYFVSLPPSSPLKPHFPFPSCRWRSACCFVMLMEPKEYVSPSTLLPPLPPHLQVVERTLRLWDNDYIVALVAQNRTTILPLIFAALMRNAKSHQNQV
ncbi:unnamed protein product [Closterium sp. Yama58-4]|nr:unnamed protein product [Closterium sp. Yama58-4]